MKNLPQLSQEKHLYKVQIRTKNKRLPVDTPGANEKEYGTGLILKDPYNHIKHLQDVCTIGRLSICP